MIEVEPWESRLAKMDHSRGTTDRMRKEAMKAEIKDLRKLAATVERRVALAQRKTIEWRSIATRYQRQLAMERTKCKQQEQKPACAK